MANILRTIGAMTKNTLAIPLSSGHRISPMKNLQSRSNCGLKTFRGQKGRCSLEASARWLALTVVETNRLELSLNNHRFRHTVENVAITNGAWITLAASFDQETRRVVVYVNGLRAEEIQLPGDFTLDIMNDEKFREYDKVWTFTNYSYGGTFQGLVAGLLSFNVILSDDQVKQLFSDK
jgi:hypothetical protein